jgi:cation diffusion facilitator family transporter
VSVTRRMAVLSIVASLVTMALKFSAYLLTGSVGLLSDALESVVNLTAALVAFGALTIAARPADDTHSYGHDKAEYFSAGVEGALILVAAATIIYAAVRRLMNPGPLEALGVGLVVSLIASAINFGVSRVMMRAGRRYDSITLEADAQHLMTDVWTSVGVVAGLAVMLIVPAWQWLDPLIAIAVGINIIVTGIGLLRRSVNGLMDYALPPAEVVEIQQAVLAAAGPEAQYHGVRTRKSGSRRFAELHLLLPGAVSVQAAHDISVEIERECEARLRNITLTVHFEPEEDPRSIDHTLDASPLRANRPDGAGAG